MEDSFTSSRIILVEPHDSKQYWKKISDILTVVDKDLGLSDTDISEYQNKKVICIKICVLLTSIWQKTGKKC